MWQTEEALFWTIVAYTLPLFILKENKKFVKVNVNSEPVQYLLIAEGWPLLLDIYKIWYWIVDWSKMFG